MKFLIYMDEMVVVAYVVQKPFDFVYQAVHDDCVRYVSNQDL